MKSDIEIARETRLQEITRIAYAIGIPEEQVENYSKYIAKIPVKLIDPEAIQKSNLILVTAITPTKAGIGKTVTSIGLSLGLNKLGKKSIVAIREPSLGPCFGMKGGAAGGGYAQVLPMEKINLHFTGDFHAITSAHNMISALLDNHIYRNHTGEQLLKEVLWKRVLDVNDRNLRYIVTGLNGSANGKTSESGFDITAASELMAILCLASDEKDLRRRIENILLGYTYNDKPFTVKDLGIAGAITVLLKDALNPNLVQTTEQGAAFIHGGPFGNIAHGCNSILATKMAMTFGDYVVTEAGFGADLGAEKFFNIKCRKSGLNPKATVVVVTTQALKMHGGIPVKQITEKNRDGVRTGLANLQRHLDIVTSFGQTPVVALNRYDTDSHEEIEIVKLFCRQAGVRMAINESWGKGGSGAEELAKCVIDTVENSSSKPITYTYENHESIPRKIEKIAKNIYGANQVIFSEKAKKDLKRMEGNHLEKFPVCIAKTQYSFSADPTAYGVPKNFTFEISDIVINQGAEFIVAIAGKIMRMPGLPLDPQARRIDLVNGEITGLS